MKLVRLSLITPSETRVAEACPGHAEGVRELFETFAQQHPVASITEVYTYGDCLIPEDYVEHREETS